MKKTLIGATAVALGALAFAVPAQAAPGDNTWVPCATSGVSNLPPTAGDCDASQVNVDGSTVTFAGTAGANIEALNLNLTLAQNDVISFDYTGPCGGGAPRVYVTIGNIVHHTGQAAEPCGTAGHVEYALPAGGALDGGVVSGWDVAAAGVVVDAPAGKVVISNVKLGSLKVNFGAYEIKTLTTVEKPSQSDAQKPTCTTVGTYTKAEQTGVKYNETVEDGKFKVTAEPVFGYEFADGVDDGPWTFAKAQLTGETACPTPTTPPVIKSPTPTPTPAKSQTVAPVPSETESTAGLPVTGPGGGTNVPLIGGLVGTALLSFGVALIVWARRRRDNVEFTA